MSLGGAAWHSLAIAGSNDQNLWMALGLVT